MIVGKNEKDGTNTLNLLNSLSKKEMEDVMNFINDDTNKSAVFDLYISMKDAEKNKPENYKKTDTKNFNDVRSAIEAKYPELVKQ